MCVCVYTILQYIHIYVYVYIMHTYTAKYLTSSWVLIFMCGYIFNNIPSINKSWDKKGFILNHCLLHKHTLCHFLLHKHTFSSG